MYDSVAMLGVPGFLLRTLSNPAGLLAGNVGVGGAHGTTGQERLPFPKRDGRRDSTDFLSTFPGTSGGAEGGEAAGHRPVDPDARGSRFRCLIGKGLTEYGVTQADLTLAKDLVKMDLPSQRRDKRWKQRQQQADPLSVLLDLQTAERCLLSYTRSPTGYAGLVGGMS